MQDISRDDFSLLNGECVVDKDCVIIRSSTNSGSTSNLPVTTSSINPSITPPPPSNIIVDTYNVCSSSSSQLHRNNTKSPNLESVSIKIEEINSSDLYNSPSSWHHHHSHHIKDKGTSKLLLRNSDDPLISRGATSVDDDNPNELKSMMMPNCSLNHDITDNPISITHTTDHHIQRSPLQVKKNRSTNNQGNTRTRRKGAFKLRFHHQALPPEYLSHYEATQNQLNLKQNTNTANVNLNNNKLVNNSKNVDGDILNKKSNVAALTRSNDKNFANSQENVRNWLQKIAEMQEAAAAKEAAELAIAAESTVSTSIEPIDIHDEIEQLCEVQSLENYNKEVQVANKPSRIVSYSDLPYMGEMTLENSKPRRGRKPKKADICHLIYKNYGTIFPGTPKDVCLNESDKSNSILAKKLTEIISKTNDDSPVLIEEPLNLCLRDQSDSYTISSDDEDSANDYDTSSNATPHELAADTITDNLLAKNLKISLSNFKKSSSVSPSNEKLDTQAHPSQNNENEKTNSSASNSGQWNDARMFMHPVALYYQKMIDSNNLQPSSQCNSPSTVNTSTTNLSIKHLSLSPKPQSKSPSILIKKEKSERPETCSTPSSIKSGISLATTNCGSSSTNQPPQKRKRSAIFIPPMPAENTSNPPTEVSICKFKFTGGAKPTLQEKKMLSVDSEGNYRYFSGTGDKSSRGYEFFPRESLQQSGVIPGVNCSGAFLNATGEKISTDLPPPSAGLSNELLQIPDTPPSALLLPPAISSSIRREHRSNCLHDRKKRKSKRSIQREKLEQTFKDKGFLIQTQQLESAEGATYCKFRQLKKFTRYLFRSWKDYLPGDVQHAQAAAAAAALVTGSSNAKSILASSHQSTAIESIRNHVESNMNKTATAAAVNKS
ncbi:ankyrin repeat-containing protein kinase A isoform X2 [Condylostylus longicornis]|nr:ankyrin repeat-containing protein kinase A isoform X2 [Condylostylus longicornis]XP_055383534.1 ankyrin repeat-containing protein kinase A isoform X2 [Condylostylus longicornis]